MIILYIVLAVIAIPFILALFGADGFTIESDIIINKPKNEVFDYIKLLKNQDNYSKWVMTDPGMKKEFTGTDGNVGFIYAWESENKQVGQGAQEIIKITEGESIDNEVRFIKPFTGTSYTTMETMAITPNQTSVKWIFKGTKNYMMKVMHILFNLQKVLKKDMDTSLNTLKTVLEK
ncbi:SRPBCC family protein [Mucilaginibacter sp. HMF5004]|uniref:SRPBCC family protein n=1 Tax=Mucilaginibacter rivuli TaxID=2857527 RepID=UPI001C5E1584|nr:SRPBCC family protein [Mucilaginibacter rivuli]MBW4891793.1 SRPBCC family protein [Mucilaginibacter rivuli]